MTVKETAEYLRVSTTSIRRWIRDDGLPAEKGKLSNPNAWDIDKAVLDAWLEGKSE